MANKIYVIIESKSSTLGDEYNELENDVVFYDELGGFGIERISSEGRLSSGGSNPNDTCLRNRMYKLLPNQLQILSTYDNSGYSIHDSGWVVNVSRTIKTISFDKFALIRRVSERRLEKYRLGELAKIHDDIWEGYGLVKFLNDLYKKL